MIEEQDEVKREGESKQCERCGGPFVAKRWWARFCGDECKVKFHIQQRREALHEYRLYRGESKPQRPAAVNPEVMSSTGAST